MRTRLLVMAGMMLLFVGPGLAQSSGGSDADDLLTRDTATDNWFGFGETLREQAGVEVGLNLTQFYQLNLSGGLATHKHEGRWTGNYDLTASADLGKLLKIPGASVQVLVEGNWSHGLSPRSIGDVMGVNGQASGDEAIVLSELFWEQILFGGRLQFRVGKIDLTGGFDHEYCPVAFDCNRYANSAATQFFNGGLGLNPTIPFPDPGIGAVVYAGLTEWLYVASGFGDAQADWRETGFNTAFHGPDYFTYLLETGLTPTLPSPNGSLRGAYRFGVWYDPQPKPRHHGLSSKRDDVGAYVSIDQMVWKEQPDPEDSQGLGVFARYGFADSDVADIRNFWSVGGQYKGPVPTRDQDVLGVGFARAALVERAGYDRGYESVLEVYYSAQLTGWMTVSSSFQYIWNPGGVSGVSNAAVLGFRMNINF